MNKKENCYYYFVHNDMGANTSCCKKHNELGNCPCEQCNSYLPKGDIDKIIEENAYLKTAFAIIAKRTDDVVSVVRCKNCKWWNENLGEYCEKTNLYPGPNWYCANGERRTPV